MKVCQRCEWSGVLTCVKYPDDVNHTTEIKCEECNQQYNTNELLREASHNKLKAHDDVIFIAEVILLPPQ